MKKLDEFKVGFWAGFGAVMGQLVAASLVFLVVAVIVGILYVWSPV